MILLKLRTTRMISPHDHTIFWIESSERIIFGEKSPPDREDQLFFFLQSKANPEYRFGTHLTKKQAMELGKELLEWSKNG